MGDAEAGVGLAGEVHRGVRFVADAEEGDGVGAVDGGGEGWTGRDGRGEAGYFGVGGEEEVEEEDG